MENKKETLMNVVIACLLIALITVCGAFIWLFLQSSQTVEQQHHATTQSTTTPKTSTPKVESNTAEVVQDGTQLEKGTNHNQKAAAYAYKTTDIRKGIYHEERYTGKKVCFLTFDDGVNFEVTPRILDILKQYNVPATFFVVGKTLNADTKELLEREIKEGHAIGIHSYTHDYQKMYPGGYVDVQQVVKEVKDTQDTLQELLGKEFKTLVWRYPGGHMSWKGVEEVDTILEKSGYEWMDWNAMIGDAEVPSARPKYPSDAMDYHANTLTIAPNDHVRVVLMHDAADKEITVQTLPYIIEYYQSQGFEFGVLS